MLRRGQYCTTTGKGVYIDSRSTQKGKQKDTAERRHDDQERGLLSECVVWVRIESLRTKTLLIPSGSLGQKEEYLYSPNADQTISVSYHHCIQQFSFGSTDIWDGEGCNARVLMKRLLFRTKEMYSMTCGESHRSMWLRIGGTGRKEVRAKIHVPGSRQVQR
jgi:hypothetical protein